MLSELYLIGVFYTQSLLSYTEKPAWKRPVSASVYAKPSSGEEVVKQATYLEELERLAAQPSREAEAERDDSSETSQPAEIVFRSVDEVRLGSSQFKCLNCIPTQFKRVN